MCSSPGSFTGRSTRGECIQTQIFCPRRGRLKTRIELCESDYLGLYPTISPTRRTCAASGARRFDAAVFYAIRYYASLFW
jgi:hypothetical protein